MLRNIHAHNLLFRKAFFSLSWKIKFEKENFKREIHFHFINTHSVCVTGELRSVARERSKCRLRRWSFKRRREIKLLIHFDCGCIRARVAREKLAVLTFVKKVGCLYWKIYYNNLDIFAIAFKKSQIKSKTFARLITFIKLSSFIWKIAVYSFFIINWKEKRRQLQKIIYLWPLLVVIDKKRSNLVSWHIWLSAHDTHLFFACDSNTSQLHYFMPTFYFMLTSKRQVLKIKLSHFMGI